MVIEIDDDILDCMDWAENELTPGQKRKVSEAEIKLKKSGKPYFCANTNLIKNLFGLTLKEGQAFNTKDGLMVVCNNNIKDGSFFTSLPFTEEELDELRNN